jgi:hypothetical protein
VSAQERDSSYSTSNVTDLGSQWYEILGSYISQIMPRNSRENMMFNLELEDGKDNSIKRRRK